MNIPPTTYDGCERAATALSEAGKLHHHPESHVKVKSAAAVIARETRAPEMYAALVEIRNLIAPIAGSLPPYTVPGCSADRLGHALTRIDQALAGRKGGNE